MRKSKTGRRKACLQRGDVHHVHNFMTLAETGHEIPCLKLSKVRKYMLFMYINVSRKTSPDRRYSQFKRPVQSHIGGIVDALSQIIPLFLSPGAP